LDHLRQLPHIGYDQPLSGPGGGHVELAGHGPAPALRARASCAKA
jgi:hypothetical protein